MTRNNTKYYVFTSPNRGGEPICQCRTLRRARNILASMLGGHIEKWRSTPSRCYLRRWLPKGERQSPTITVKRLYKKIWRGELEMIDTPEVAYLLEEQDKKIANLICENYRLKSLLDDAGIPYVYNVKGEER